ncbi:MAG TPA: Hsp70 family protein [Actinophytocola sp.]|uniref:Hsp70 family protein n=1 Tax=Actinophytocola sp. TaxID=1872138 RepID=UPI002F933C60
MPYALGIDLGSGHLTAAICRNDHERWSEPQVMDIDGVPITEAVLHLTDEGTVEIGARALRYVTARPDYVTRGFVDRVGDEVPVILGGRPYPAEVLIAAAVGWIADYAEAIEGMPASQLVVTHPAGWGGYRRAVLLGALRETGLPELTLLPRPVAAAESYAATEPVEVGQEIAVHSLGAGRFESAVLRRGSFGFDLRAHAHSMETTGGDLFDDLLAAKVLDELGDEVEPVALAKLRATCRKAKERLSTELAVTVPAPPRSPRGTVMVNRTDLEELIRPAVEATVSSLQRTIQAAGTSTGTLRAVVLVGGCGRIPLVSELVSVGVRVRVAAAADPELSIARGAALAAARVAKPTVQARALAHQPLAAHTPEPVRPAGSDLVSLAELPPEDLADIGPPPPRPPVEITPLEPPKRRMLPFGRRDDEDVDDDRERYREDEPDEEREPARTGGRRRESLFEPRRRDWDSAELDVPRRRRAEERHWPDDDEPAARSWPAEPRRRHRTDDRAFNESLPRNRHGRRENHADYVDGEYEVADEPRRGREAR